MEWVEKSGPWNFENNLLLLCRWKKGLSSSNIGFTHAPFWVQIWGLPFEFMCEEVGKDIDGTIGNFLEVDKRSWQSDQAKYMRIRVEVQLNKPLRRGGYVTDAEGGKHWVTYKYERLPTLCFFCGKLGHDIKHYGGSDGVGNRAPSDTPNVPGSDFLGGNTFSEANHSLGSVPEASVATSQTTLLLQAAENPVGWDKAENSNQNQQKIANSRAPQRKVNFGGSQSQRSEERASASKVGHLESLSPKTQEATSPLRPKLERKCKPEVHPMALDPSNCSQTRKKVNLKKVARKKAQDDGQAHDAEMFTSVVEEDHDWLEWTSKVGTTQVTPARFMLERNIEPSSNNNQYLILTQNEEEEEGDDEVISYWSEDNSNWFFDDVAKDFPNKGKVL
nr:uncharacterized protein CFP56_15941 [Quercus suber]